MRRSIAAASLSLAMTITVVAGSAAQSPGPFCAILSAEEVSTAVGAEIAPTYGDDRSCNYASSATDVFTALYVTNGGTQMDIAKSIYTEGRDVTVAGQPGWLRTGDFDSNLYIDRGDGDTLSFQLLSPPAGVDPGAALESLGALAFPRLATLVIPTPTPEVIVQQDPELAALFPTEIAGAALTTQTQTEGLSIDDDAERAQLEALLAAQGKTLDDVSIGFAFSMEPPFSITAIRVKGADASALRDPILTMSDVEGTPTPAQVAGKDMLVATVSGQPQHVYAKGDVLWLVFAQEPILTEVFQKLP
jgi:hypothetical protein